MKPFALHLIVVFILGAEYQRLQTFCSSLPASTSTASSTLSSSSSSSSSFSPSPLFASRSIAGGVYSGPAPSATVQHQNGAKTSRTIHRLIAGHIQHSPNNSTNRLSKAHFRRKVEVHKAYSPQATRTVLKKVEPPPATKKPNDHDYPDSAFLEDTNDIESWDDGILRLSAGAGKEEQTKNKKKEDSKKTLSDQVRDGKYGLIENELFKQIPKRPGIISYSTNKEVPEDNASNYGGLKEDDIWLAEDHLLVIKGGSLNSDSVDEPWTPIDNYESPKRPIKIPPNPKVPPPFPVQFEDGGPIQFIGDHKFPFFYPKDANGTLSLFPENGYPPTQANGNDEKNLLAGSRSSQNATSNQDRYLYPPAYPPWLFNNESFKNPFLNFGPPPPNSFPFDNNSDYIDEDDPSLYYPPPYTFVYKSNYSNPVSPGPLVPGIVLPPPPNSFARLEDKPQRTPTKTIPFSTLLNKIAEEKYKLISTTSTTTAAPDLTTSIRTTTHAAPERTKEVFYVKQRTRPYIPTTTTPLAPVTTTTLSPIPPEIISFVPQVQTAVDQLSTAKPIYYEYFDARKVLATPTAFAPFQHPTERPYSASISSSVSQNAQSPPIPYKPQKIYSTPIYRVPTTPTRRPVQVTQTQKPLRINPVHASPKPYDYNEYLYISPKPEIYPNGISSNIISQPPARQPFKIQANFDREVDAIRQTLQYYKTQQLQQSHIARAPKPKALYAYSTAAPPTPNYAPSKVFTPPANFDSEPFKPMVQYSRPVDDTSGFRAIAYPRTDNLAGESPYYSTTQQPETIQVELQVGDNLNNRPASFNAPSADYSYRDQRVFTGKPLQPNSQYLPQRNPILVKQPWVSVEKQVVHEIIPPSDPNTYRPTAQKNINRSISGFSQSVQRNQQPDPRFRGYYYSQPVPQRLNHRFQHYPEQNFNKDVGAIRTQLNQYRFEQQQQPPASLENDTYVNSLPSRTINPDAEYISLPPRRELFQQQRLPPAPQSQQNPGDIYRKPADLERDILVNYKAPLPPINPDSEFIRPQFGGPQRQQQQYYQRPQYSNFGGGFGPIPSNSRPPNVYYVNPQRDFRFKGA